MIHTFEQEFDAVVENNSLIGSKSEDSIVIHHGIQAFDPTSINVAVENNPLMLDIFHVYKVAQFVAEKALLPSARHVLNSAIELRHCDRLWIHNLVGRIE